MKKDTSNYQKAFIKAAIEYNAAELEIEKLKQELAQFKKQQELENVDYYDDVKATE